MESHALHTIHPNVRQVFEPQPMKKPYMLLAYRARESRWSVRGFYETEHDAVVAAQKLHFSWTFYRIYNLEL